MIIAPQAGLTTGLSNYQRKVILDLMARKKQQISAGARDDLINFAKLTHPKYEANWHHHLLAKKLQGIVNGTCKRLIISMPPRHGKTEIASIRFGPYYLGHNPTHNVVQATYAAEFAEENSKKSRNIVASEQYRNVFGFGLAPDSKAVSRWQTEKGGTYYAVGVGGQLTGKGANCLIIDDPHKDRKEAESLKMRSNVWDWFRSTAYTRLEDNGAVIVIMTRWHEGDLVGCLLSGEEKWDVVSLPAIAEQNDAYRNEGDPLWIKKFNLADLNNIRTAIGSREWISLYQQRPTAADGEIFKREYWRFYREVPIFQKIVHSWDTAFKKGADNDYSVCTIWGIAANGYYLLFRWKQRVEFPELKRTVISLANQIPANEIIIEDKASGQSLIQELQRDTRLPIVPFKVDSDKVARANASSPVIEAGKVFLPEDAEWVEDYIDTLAAFPKAVHDDDVDSTTMALISMQSRQKYSFASL